MKWIRWRDGSLRSQITLPETKGRTASVTLVRSPFEFYSEDQPRDERGRFGEGTGGGDGSGGEASRAEQIVTDNPRQPGEDIFSYCDRVIDGLDRETANDVLFHAREQYEPVPFLADAVNTWCEQNDLTPPPPYVHDTPVDLEEADLVGEFFENATDRSGDPEVEAAYADFKDQSEEMFDFVTRDPSEGGLGIIVDFVDQKDPYPDATAQAADLRDNHHISIESGLGGAHGATMTTEEYDRFRAVHDIFGHAATGGGFDRHGEYQAWLTHAAMYEGAGRDAMSTEYHAVNSALWGGTEDPGGTGKSVLIPDEWSDPPWDRWFTSSAGVGAIEDTTAKDLVEMLPLPPHFAQDYDPCPWHTADAPPSASTASAHLRSTPWEFYSEDQPRDERGRFGEGGGGDAAVRVDHVGDGRAVAQLLADGARVEIPATEVSTLLDRLAALANEAKAAGRDAAVIDLCDVTVPGTNLFCAESHGIPREEMPQLAGKAVEGTPAGDLVGAGNFIDATDAFLDSLRESGVEFRQADVPSAALKATQNELDGSKVAGIMKSAEAGTLSEGNPLFVSAENFVLDGHHRWAADVGREYVDGVANDEVRTSVIQVEMPILELVERANEFAAEYGIAAKKLVGSLLAALLGGSPFEFYSEDQPRDDHGRWGEGGGGDSTSSAEQSVINRVRSDEGITLQPLTGEIPTDGYIVGMNGQGSIEDEDDFFGEGGIQAIDDFLRDHADAFDDPETFMGLWHDTDHDEVAIDVVVHVATEQAAVQLGRDQDQQSIYDVVNKKVIETGGTGGRKEEEE